MLEGKTNGGAPGVLAGKTVWIVEPERFSSHALESALDELKPREIVLVGSVEEARTRLDRVGPGGTPQLAVIDFTGEGDARALADDLRGHGATVMRTVPANGMECASPDATSTDEASTDATSPAERAAGLPAMRDVRRPYAPAEVARAIARHYGL